MRLFIRSWGFRCVGEYGGRELGEGRKEWLEGREGI